MQIKTTQYAYSVPKYFPHDYNDFLATCTFIQLVTIILYKSHLRESSCVIFTCVPYI